MDKSGNEPLDGDEDWWKPPKKKISSVLSEIGNNIKNAFESVFKTETKSNPPSNTSSSKICWVYGASTPYAKDVFKKVPVPCPPETNKGRDFLSGLANGIGEIVGNAIQGIGSLITRPNITSPSFAMDNHFYAKQQAENLKEMMKTEKFWYQIGVTISAGVATLAVGGLLLLSPIAVTGLGIAGATGAVVSVSHNVSGQYYDYDVTYGGDMQKMLEANGYSSVEELFGYNVVKQLFNGVAGYAAGKSIYSFGKGASGAGSSVREKLLGQVENPKLKNAVNEIYRPGATTGDGGLADAVRHELSTGELVGGKSHVKKAMERVTNLENIIKKQELSGGDLEIANKLLDDLKNALGGK